MSDDMEFEESFEDDEFGFDDEFSMFDSEPPKPPDRSPVVHSVITTGKKFKDSFTEDKAETAMKFASATVPDKISGEVADIGNVVSSVREDLSKAKVEIRTTAKPFVKAVESIIPKGGKTETFLNLAKEKLGLDEEEKTAEDIAADAAARAAGQVSEILGEQQDREFYTNMLKESIQAKKDETDRSISIKSLSNLEFLNNFNQDVTAKYQRKSLELQYRHLFTADEQLSLTKTGLDIFKDQLEAIRINSALPDLVKTKNSEFIKQKMFNQVADGLFNTTGVVDNLKKKFTDEITGLKDGIVSGMSGATDMIDMTNTMKENSEMMGGKEGMAADAASDFVIGKLGSKFGNLLGKTKLGKKAISNVQSMMLDPSERLRELEEGTDSKLLKNIFGTVSDFTDNTNKENSFGIEKLDRNDVAMFDGKTQTSITKIIPGLLSKILSEVTSIRTGSKEDELRFDYDKGTFDSTSNLKTNIDNKIKNSVVSTGLNTTVTDIVTALQKETDLKLKGKDLEALKESIVLYSLSGKSVYPNRLEENGFYDYFPKDIRDKVKDSFNGYITGGKNEDENFARIAKLNRSLTEVVKRAPDPQELLDTYNDAGNIDILKESGLVNFDKHSGQYSLDSENYKELLSKSIHTEEVAKVEDDVKSKSIFVDRFSKYKEEKKEEKEANKDKPKEEPKSNIGKLYKNVNDTINKGVSTAEEAFIKTVDGEYNDKFTKVFKDGKSYLTSKDKNDYSKYKFGTEGSFDNNNYRPVSNTRSLMGDLTTVKKKVTNALSKENVDKASILAKEMSTKYRKSNLPKLDTKILTKKKSPIDSSEDNDTNIKETDTDSTESSAGIRSKKVSKKKTPNVTTAIGNVNVTNRPVIDNNMLSVLESERDKNNLIDKLIFVTGGGYNFSSSKLKQKFIYLLRAPIIPINIIELLLDFGGICTIGHDTKFQFGGSAAYVKEIEETKDFPAVKEKHLFLITEETIDIALNQDASVLIEMVEHEHIHLLQSLDGRLEIPGQPKNLSEYYYNDITFDSSKFKTATHMLPFKDYLDSPWEDEAYNKGYSSKYDFLVNNKIIDPKEISKDTFVKKTINNSEKAIKEQMKTLLPAYKESFKTVKSPWYYDRDGGLDYDKIPSQSALLDDSKYTFDNPYNDSGVVNNKSESNIDTKVDNNAASNKLIIKTAALKVDNNDNNVKSNIENKPKVVNSKKSISSKLMDAGSKISNISKTITDNIKVPDVIRNINTNAKESIDDIFDNKEKDESSKLLKIKTFVSNAYDEVFKMEEFLANNPDKASVIQSKIDKTKAKLDKLINIDLKDDENIKDKVTEVSSLITESVTELTPNSEMFTKSVDNVVTKQVQDDQSFLEILNSDDPIGGFKSKITNGVKDKLKSGGKKLFDMGKKFIKADLERGKNLRGFLKDKLTNNSPGILSKGKDIANNIIKGGVGIGKDIASKTTDIVSDDLNRGTELRSKLFNKSNVEDNITKVSNEDKKDISTDLTVVGSNNNISKSLDRDGSGRRDGSWMDKRDDKEEKSTKPSLLDKGKDSVKKLGLIGSGNVVNKAFDRDGSGRRDGSWMDRLKKDDESKDNKEDNSSEEKEDKTTTLSTMSKVLLGITAVASLFKITGEDIKGFVKGAKEGISNVVSVIKKTYDVMKWGFEKLVTGFRYVKTIPERISLSIGKIIPTTLGGLSDDEVAEKEAKLNAKMNGTYEDEYTESGKKKATKEEVAEYEKKNGKGSFKRDNPDEEIASEGSSAGSTVGELAAYGAVAYGANKIGGKHVVKGAAKLTGKIGGKAINAVTNKVPLKSTVNVVKAVPKKKIVGSSIMKIIKGFKSKIVSKLGKKASKGIVLKLGAKIASRLVPFAGAALLAYDAGKISYDMLTNGTDFKSAASKQLLGFDLFDDEDLPKDANGDLIKPDENEVEDHYIKAEEDELDKEEKNTEKIKNDLKKSEAIRTINKSAERDDKLKKLVLKIFKEDNIKLVEERKVIFSNDMGEFKKRKMINRVNSKIKVINDLIKSIHTDFDLHNQDDVSELIKMYSKEYLSITGNVLSDVLAGKSKNNKEDKITGLQKIVKVPPKDNINKASNNVDYNPEEDNNSEKAKESSGNSKFLKEFKTGGYTGKGDPDKKAGIVHKDEHVTTSKELDELSNIINKEDENNVAREDLVTTMMDEFKVDNEIVSNNMNQLSKELNNNTSNKISLQNNKIASETVHSTEKINNQLVKANKTLSSSLDVQSKTLDAIVELNKNLTNKKLEVNEDTVKKEKAVNPNKSTWDNKVEDVPTSNLTLKRKKYA